MAKARSLSKSEMNRALDICFLLSNPTQKRAILSLSFSGLRVTELTRLTVEDVMTKKGRLKDELYLRSEITKGCKPRTVRLSERTLKILSEYIEHRLHNQIGISIKNQTYKGLNPRSKLILSSRGYGYSLKAKSRLMIDGTEKIYYSNDTVEALIRKIYSSCGLHGASSHSGRRSLGTALNKRGVELEAISRILGHSDVQVTLEYIDISKSQMEKLYELAL